jgi:hypothetical protein
VVGYESRGTEEDLVSLLRVELERVGTAQFQTNFGDDEAGGTDNVPSRIAEHATAPGAQNTKHVVGQKVVQDVGAGTQ